jgi:hypothetical protein
VAFARGPGPMFGARLGLSAASYAWAIGVEGAIDSTGGYVDVDGGRARLLMATGAALGCHRRPYLSLCALASLGVAQGEATDVEQPVVRRTFASFTGVRVGAPVPITAGLFLEPTIDLLAALVRTRFMIDQHEAWTAPSFTLTLGLAFRVSP